MFCLGCDTPAGLVASYSWWWLSGPVREESHEDLENDRVLKGPYPHRAVCGESMNLRHRRMQPEDIPECVDIVARHPVVGPRYGQTIELLAEAWLRTLG